MTCTMHPDPATLMSYAAGAMMPALAAVVACHAAICAHCRGELRMLEGLGLCVLSELPAVPLSRPVPLLALRSVEAEIDWPKPAQNVGEVPAPLAMLIGDSLDAVLWTSIVPGVFRHTIKLPGEATGILMLVKAEPGRSIPEHAHAGGELTYVLRGAYRDQTGVYRAGDVADVDADLQHTPAADPSMGCICLVAMEGPPVRKGNLIARIAVTLGR